MNTASKHIPMILVALFIAVAPHMIWLPSWIVAWCLLFWGYSFQISRRGWRPPRAPLRHIFVFAGLLAVMIHFEWTIDGYAGVGLLAIMAALKPLEISSYRDKMIAVFLAYFLVLTNLFYTDSLAMTLYMLLSVLVTTAVLIGLHALEERIKATLRLSARLMIQASPIMIACFFLFPRIQGSLWGFAQRPVAKIGFTDRLALGDISKLVQNSAVAFRATFHGPMPKRNHRYWRGLVFWHFTGGTWQRGIRVPYRRDPVLGKETVHYTIALEPHEKKWRFALDLPVFAPPHVRMLDDHTLRSRRDLKARVVYTVQSHTVFNTGPLKQWEQIALQLPAGGNPKAAEMARKCAKSAGSSERIVDFALAFFKKNGFTYSLEPPLLEGQDLIDDFLFRTRKGYCEHFASAFAYLMRAAKIPARIVVGYLGGEQNPFGNYLIVRQSDAHAWVEVWLASKGWTRIDPTSVVAPERVEQGMTAALPLAERPSYLTLPYLAQIFRYWKQVRFGWDAVNTYWNRWVVGYSRIRQKQLFLNLGISGSYWKSIIKSVLYVLGFIGIAAILFFAGRLIPYRSKKEPVQHAYAQFCQKLARAGLPRRPEQGPLDYARQVGVGRKDLAERVDEISRIYIRLRYGRGANDGSVKKLISLVKKFKPKKA